MPVLSLRHLWVTYKRRLLLQHVAAATKHDQAIATMFAREAFYSGARAVLQVLGDMLKDGDYDELHRTIQQQARLIDKIQGREQPRPKRH